MNSSVKALDMVEIKTYWNKVRIEGLKRNWSG